MAQRRPARDRGHGRGHRGTRLGGERHLPGRRAAGPDRGHDRGRQRRGRRRHDPVDRRYAGALPVLRPGRLAHLGETGRAGCACRSTPAGSTSSTRRPAWPSGHARRPPSGPEALDLRRSDRAGGPKRSHRRTGASTPRSCPPRARSRRRHQPPISSARSDHGHQPQMPGSGFVQPAGVETTAVVGDPDRDAVTLRDHRDHHARGGRVLPGVGHRLLRRAVERGPELGIGLELETIRRSRTSIPFPSRCAAGTA